MPTVTFLQGQWLAIETDRGSAPSGGKALAGAGAPWWNGGRRIPVITDGLPDLQDAQAVIFPTGHAGVRPMNQQSPVVGRKWSEGGMKGPAVADVLAALLYGALGSLSSNMVPANAPSLLTNEPVHSTPNAKSLVLSNQPDSGGNVLRFDLKGSVAACAVGISGIDSYGNAASEVISFASEGLFYSRTSWSTIGASGISFSGLSATTSVTITGIKNFVHTFSAASVSPTMTIERSGTPTAGNAASRAFIHPAMAITELTLNTPAATNDGIVNFDVSFVGDPTAGSVSASLNHASPMKIWPAWVLKVTRDNGSAWNRPTEFNVKIGTGMKNLNSAGGSQGPQGTLSGPMEITGNITLYAEDELEYNRWKGASQTVLYARWYTGWPLTSGQNIELGASLPIYFENMKESDQDDAFVLNADFRTVSDSNFGIGRFELLTGLPGRALGNAVI